MHAHHAHDRSTAALRLAFTDVDPEVIKPAILARTGCGEEEVQQCRAERLDRDSGLGLTWQSFAGT